MVENNLLLGMSLAGLGATIAFIIVVNYLWEKKEKKETNQNL